MTLHSQGSSHRVKSEVRLTLLLYVTKNGTRKGTLLEIFASVVFLFLNGHRYCMGGGLDTHSHDHQPCNLSPEEAGGTSLPARRPTTRILSPRAPNAQFSRCRAAGPREGGWSLLEPAWSLLVPAGGCCYAARTSPPKNAPSTSFSSFSFSCRSMLRRTSGGSSGVPHHL